MKKTISVLLCMILLLTPLTAFAATAQNEETAALSFVVLGDSIAEGAGAMGKANAYASIVAAENGYDLNNLARGGSTSPDLLEWVLEKEELREAVAGADIINISIGGNDFLLSNIFLLILNALLNNYTPAAEIIDGFKENFAVIMGEIRELNPNATIVVQTLYNPVWWIPVVGSRFDVVVNMLNDCYYAYLEENPDAYVIADVYDAFYGEFGLIFFDLIHPSKRGHAKIADLLLETLADLD